MRLLILTAALLMPASSAALAPQAWPQKQNASPAAPRGVPVKSLGTGKCERADLVTADQNGKVSPRNLGELPSGTLSLAVMREVDGCYEPVVVRQGFGGGEPLNEQDYSSPRPRAKLYH